jgi:uncharacterized protein with NRDE domain
MCLITFAHDIHPRYRMMLAANRDEFYDRSAASAGFWEDQPSILAGRDLEQMGTWLGVTKKGRFAAVTNYRDPNEMKERTRSRGELVSDFLSGNEQPYDYLNKIKQSKHSYNGFNLIVGDSSSLYYFSNINNDIQKLESGIYGLSNELLDSDWPKVTNSKRLLEDCMNTGEEVDPECLFELLARTDQADDHKLPNTGVSRELERLLSSHFIKSSDYGTRASTVMLIDVTGRVFFKERSFGRKTTESKEKTFEFKTI